MRCYSFQHPLMKPIDIRAEQFIQITGQNKLTQFYVKQVIEWTTSGHRYSELEVESLANQELIWKCDDKIIKKSDYQYIRLSCREDLLYQLSGKKGSIVSTFFERINNSVEVACYLEKINELLELIALECQKKNHHYNLKYEFEIKPMTLPLVTQQHLIPYLSDSQLYCAELMSSTQLLDTFLKILTILLQESANRYLVCFENLNQLLSCDEVYHFLTQFECLSSQYELLVVNFGQGSGDLLIERNTLESIMICGDKETQQFYDWMTIVDYLERNYPTIFTLSDEEIIYSLRKVIPYLLSHVGMNYLGYDRNLVIFILLNEGFCFQTYKNEEVAQLSSLELNFLKEKLYK